MDDLRKSVESAYNTALNYAESSQNRQKKTFDKKVRGATLQIGDRVVLRNVVPPNLLIDGQNRFSSSKINRIGLYLFSRLHRKIAVLLSFIET